MKLDDTHSARHGAQPSHHEATSDDTSIFDVVWNSDLSLHCQAINKTLRLEQNGVRANADQAWFGDTIATLYGAGAAMPSAAGPNGSLINNGIPQLADRDLIKNATATLLGNSLPEGFSGFGAFDIEYPSLYPLWAYDFGAEDQTVRRLATNWTAARHPELTGPALQNQTAEDFDAAMAELWELQLETAADLFPRGRFGYYRMPHCWYNNAEPFAPCNGQERDADKLAWLWRSEGALFPGAYFGSDNNANATARIISTIREAVRVAQAHGGGRPKVMPFVSYAYRGGSKDHRLLPADMMWKMLSVPASLGVAGVVVWGGSGDVHTVDCDALSDSLDVVGPRLKELRARLSACAVTNCSGHGRCASFPSPHCVCDAGRGGASCDKVKLMKLDDEASEPAAAPAFTVDVGSTGELSVAVAGSSLALTVLSSFDTSVGQATFGQSGAAAGWNVSTTRISDEVWMIVGALQASGQQLLRIERTATVESQRVAFTDAITVGAVDDVLGLDVTHSVQIGGGVRVINATVPGASYPYRCSSLNEQDASVDPKGPRLHRGTQGNPSVHAQTTDGGVGMLPLDDAFELHAYATQAAIAIPPGWPNSCAVTSPPSLSLRDQYLALPAGSSHVMEWAIYPSSTGDYYHFINAVRRDIGADQVSIPVGTDTKDVATHSLADERIVARRGLAIYPCILPRTTSRSSSRLATKTRGRR